ncbi:hypothetical protein [Polaromonas sp. CG9_12]|nr:hypothetical protein [Polaromonas sp. CG9_12]
MGNFLGGDIFLSQQNPMIIGARKKGPDHAVWACKSTL